MSDAAEVVVGQITKAHGVRGAIRVRATGATLATLARGDEVTLEGPDGTRRRAEVDALDVQSGGAIVRFRGVETRTDAEALRGALVKLDTQRLASLPDDEFYVRDMIGCEVWVAGRAIGAVHEVIPGAANDVLDVRGAGGDVLVPFTRDALLRVDLAARRVDVRDGLLLLEDPAP